MDMSLIITRLIHVLGGIIWVGTMVFMTVFLMPTLAEMGPDAGKVMAGLTKRKFMAVMPIVAILVILSGLYLYWNTSGGFNHDYMKSGPGHSYAFGGIAAILAFLIGVTVIRPSMMKAVALSASAAQAPEAERGAILGAAQAARARGEKASKLVIWLLIFAAITMAIGRYV
jgi:uncharacterized membrane protein